MPDTDLEPRSPRLGRLRGIGSFLLKAVVTSALVVWLVRSGGLNFAALKLLWTNPLVACSGLLNFVLGFMFCSAWRWRLLLAALGVRLSLRHALGLQSIAGFFNFFVPGNVSGDLIKNHAVADKDAGRLVAVTLVERVSGLIGLVWAAVPSLIYSGKTLVEHRGGGQLIAGVMTLFILSLVGPLIGYAVLRRLGNWESRSTSQDVWARRVLHFLQAHVKSGTSTLLTLAARPKVLLSAILVSLLMHSMAMVNFWIVARHLDNAEATFAQVAALYPIGILSVMVPVSISGLGVGHVLFNELFRMLGLVRGADVFNVHMFSSLFLSLSGAVVYLLRKGRAQTAQKSHSEVGL